MISLRKTADQLDCYSQALRSTAQNVIEVDETEAARFRSDLEALRARLQSNSSPRDLEMIQYSFDAELKDYHQKTTKRIEGLRREVKAAASAVESFAGSIYETEDTVETGLKQELSRLNKAASSDDIQVLRGAIAASTAKIAASIQQMRSATHLAIAQLKDEIRVLHEQVSASRPKETDPSAESHQRIQAGIDDFMRKSAPFSVLLVVVRNLEGLENCYSTQAIDNALRSFETRFENILPVSTVFGRWARDQFAAILSAPSASAMDMSADVVRKLSEPFVAYEKGESKDAARQSLAFNPRAGVIEYSPGSDPAKFQAKLKQLAETLAA